MKKQLNVDVIANELRGNSAFFPRYKKREAKTGRQQPAAALPQRPASAATPEPPVRVVPPVPPVRGKKRVMKQRHPFDIYRDQYEALQALALEERMHGGVGSMSAMVREAIDALLEERWKK